MNDSSISGMLRILVSCVQQVNFKVAFEGYQLDLLLHGGSRHTGIGKLCLNTKPIISGSNYLTIILLTHCINFNCFACLIFFIKFIRSRLQYKCGLSYLWFVSGKKEIFDMTY